MYFEKLKDGEIEVWKDVVGYEGYYQVSNIGNVKSLDREYLDKNGNHKFFKERLLSLQFNTRANRGYGAYKNVHLYGIGKRKPYKVHRLVALSFIENPQNKSEINHIDGNKLNNRVENLEWVTRSENAQHMYDIGLSDLSGQSIGIKNPKVILSEHEVYEIRELLITKTPSDIYKAFKVSISTINDIKKGRTWKHLK